MTLAEDVVPGRVEDAPAKVNLALHVTGRRTDGYHLLDSLVAFAAVPDGDRVRVTFSDGASGEPELTVSGPFAGSVPADRDNIVLAAARACGGIERIHLEKGFPVAAGIGGGSADAAAVLRAVAAHRGIEASALADIALSLGADVPVCLAGRSCRMEGIGERLTPITLPEVPALLVNCGQPLATGAIFSGLARRDNPPLPPIKSSGTPHALSRWLKSTRNDLEDPARALAPEIGAVVSALTALDGCLIARMSGSGATVFALFDCAATRDAGLAALRRARAFRPQWWVRRATLCARGA